MTARRKRMTALQEEVCLARGELLDGEICQLATTLAGRGPLEKSPLLKPKGSGYVSPDTPLELESMASQDLDWRQLSGQGQRGSQSPKGFGHRQDPKPLALDVAGPLDEDRIAAKVNKRLLPSLFLLALACSLDRANLSFAALQLNHDLGFTKMEYGLGSGLFFIAYAFLQIPATLLCVRLGAVPFLSASLMLWGIVACLFASLRSPVQFFILRFLLGLAESGAYPGMWHLMHQFYNAEQLGVAYTCVALATSVSGVLGGPLAAALLSLDGIVGLRGWQVLFLAEGLPSVLLGVILFCSLPRSPAEASFLQPEERAFLTMHRGHHGEALGTPKVDPRDSEWRRRWGAGGYRAMSRGLTIPPVEAEEAGSLRGPSEVLGAPMHTQVSPWWGFAVDWRIWWLALVWGLSAAALDGIVFWAPMLINRIFKGGGGSRRRLPCRVGPLRSLGTLRLLKTLCALLSPPRCRTSLQPSVCWGLRGPRSAERSATGTEACRCWWEGWLLGGPGNRHGEPPRCRVCRSCGGCRRRLGRSRASPLLARCLPSGLLRCTRVRNGEDVWSGGQLHGTLSDRGSG
eukprot:jgi/Botrbrau1/65/Bobra.0022s0058.1